MPVIRSAGTPAAASVPTSVAGSRKRAPRARWRRSRRASRRRGGRRGVRDADQVDALHVVGPERGRRRPRHPGAAFQRGREPRIDEHEPAAGPQRVARLPEREQRRAGGGRQRVAEPGHHAGALRRVRVAHQPAQHALVDPVQAREVQAGAPGLVRAERRERLRVAVEALGQVQHEVRLARGESHREPLGGAPVGVAHRIPAEADDARAPHPRPLPGLLRHQLAERLGVGAAGVVRHRPRGRRPRPRRSRRSWPCGGAYAMGLVVAVPCAPC